MTPPQISRERIDECKWEEMHVEEDWWSDDAFLWTFVALCLVAVVLGAW